MTRPGKALRASLATSRAAACPAPAVEPAPALVSGPTRTAFLDPDYRRDPKTNLFCCRCQKDMKPGAVRRRVYLREDGVTALHPDDVMGHALPSDLGWQWIGTDCARAIGLAFTVEAAP